MNPLKRMLEKRREKKQEKLRRAKEMAKYLCTCHSINPNNSHRCNSIQSEEHHHHH